jgi:hypothetical protein
MCSLKDFEHLKLDEAHRMILIAELEIWHEWYLPCGIECQLDIGAGNGETAQFYLNHGCKHVISIEPDADLLYANFGRDPRVTIIPIAIDGIKIDGEGCERNMSLEIHFPFKLEFARQSMLADIYTSTWKLKPLHKTEKLIHSRLLNYDLITRQALHFIRRSQLSITLHRIKIRMAHLIRLILNALRGIEC